MGVRVAQETGLGSVSQQRLDHRQGDQLGVGQLGSDPHRGSLGHPLGMLDQQIINRHIYCGSEGVEVRVHTRSPGIGEVFSPQILDTPTPTPKTVDYPPTPLGTTHLGLQQSLEEIPGRTLRDAGQTNRKAEGGVVLLSACMAVVLLIFRGCAKTLITCRAFGK